MKITGGADARSVRANGATQKRAAAGGPGFASHLGASAETAQSDVASGPGSVAALLAVQASGDALEGRRQAYDRGEALLKRLESLRIALLDGRVDDDALKKLAAEMQQASAPVNDPALTELMAEIELRAMVELAKRGLA